jgi:uncharacterized zinc-type alcohol dehydrogenase-like protein
MAVRLASAMGAEVSVVSRGTAKSADAIRLGATQFISSEDADALHRLRSTQDLILSTVSAPSLDEYLQLLRRNGALVSVGLGSQRLSVSPSLLMRNRRSVASSNIGGISETAEMLAFCAEQGISAEVEIVEPHDIDSAYERVAGGDVRYRLVVDMASL